MRLYLDDNLVGHKLIQLLQKAGHTVVLPASVGLAAASDPRHFLHALVSGLSILTANHKDFRDLHDLVRGAGGSHAGVLLAYYDSDASRDMKPHDIVRAIRKLEAAKAPLANQLIVLNQWR